MTVSAESGNLVERRGSTGEAGLTTTVSSPPKDPPIRADGKCAYDHCTTVWKKKQRRPLVRGIEDEPFCSTECCKAFYGVAGWKPEEKQPAAFKECKYGHVRSAELHQCPECRRIYQKQYEQNRRVRIRGGMMPKARKTHCVHGHEYTPENTYVTKHGTRVCRTCNRAAQKEWARRKREERETA